MSDLGSLRQVKFGPFQLDSQTGELRRGSVPVKLQPQPARLLVMLVSRPGELVNRDEIRAQLWSADTFVDFDQSVNFCVRQIRAALRDDADEPCYLETVPKRGYRFIAPVQPATEHHATGHDPIVTEAGRERRHPVRTFVGATVFIGLLGALAFVTIARGRVKEASPSGIQPAVASGTHHAISPEVREQVMLGRFFLNRASRNDVTKAMELFQAAIARDPECAAAYAGLADVYNRLGSVYVAGAPPANARLLAFRAATRATQLDPDLAEAQVSLGYATMHEFDWVAAETALKRALRLNPGYAPAHTVYATYLVARGRAAEAVDEARRALSLDPLSVNIRHALGWMLYFNHEYDAAIRELQTTLQMDPLYSYGRWRLGQVEIVTRRFDDAVRDLERAAVDGQRAPAILGLLAIAYAGRGRSADAKRLLLELKTRDKTETIPPGAITLAYIGVGDYASAIAALEEGSRATTATRST
jgi:DNA-binding winged helix-turn-helix (wHTH) protein/Tfp pilus assembly protein PilF